MDSKITEKDRKKAQQLIGEVFLLLSDISDAEERLNHIKKQSAELYGKLDDIADGENSR